MIFAVIKEGNLMWLGSIKSDFYYLIDIMNCELMENCFLIRKLMKTRVGWHKSMMLYKEYANNMEDYLLRILSGDYLCTHSVWEIVFSAATMWGQMFNCSMLISWTSYLCYRIYDWWSKEMVSWRFNRVLLIILEYYYCCCGCRIYTQELSMLSLEMEDVFSFFLR